MANDLYNDDVVIDTTDDLDDTTNSSSNISDDSSHTTPPSVTPPSVNPIDVSDDTNRIIDGWIRDTTDTGGTAGETYNDTPPTEQPPLTPPVYKTVTRTIQEIITNYNQAYLQQLAEQGGKFYVYYTDGTRDEVEYTEIVDPYVAQTQTLVVEVDEITKANNQHFWYDSNGAHVTDETRESWEENAGYNFSDLSDSNNHNNLLMNSYGLIIRRALKNLAAFSRSAVVFYDGDGNETSNVLATFGRDGAIIGPSDSTRMIINNNGLRGIGGLSVPFLDVKLEGVSSTVLVNEYTDYYRQPRLDETIDVVTFLETNYELNNGDEINITFCYKTYPQNGSGPEKLYNYSFYVGTPESKLYTFDNGETNTIEYDGERHIHYTITLPQNYVLSITYITIKLYKTFRIPSFIFGLGQASGAFSVSEGLRTASLGAATHAEGTKTTASGNSSHAEGDSTKASGNSSHAEGYRTTASGDKSHAEGVDTTASESGSHAEGYNTKASGLRSHAEGETSTASSAYSHAEGYHTTASGDSSHAEGKYSTASNNGSHAEGYNTKASEQYAHAEGVITTASGNGSHAEGYDTTASGADAHAEGYRTTASGDRSHAEGRCTIASGVYSHAQNDFTIAASSDQTAIGKYNIEDANDVYAFIIGNGTADNVRSNAFTVDWDGNINFSGKIPVSKLSWDGNENLVPKATANNQEWSIDLDPNGYTGTYWHVWTSAKSTILRCDVDSGRVTMPYEVYSNVRYNVKMGSIQRGVKPSAVAYGNYEVKDANEKRLSITEFFCGTDGTNELRFYVLGNIASGDYYSGIIIRKSFENTACASMVYNANNGNLELGGAGTVYSGWETAYNNGIFATRSSKASLVMANRSSQADYGGLYICDGNVGNFVARNFIREQANNGNRSYIMEVSRTVNGTRTWNSIAIGLNNANNAVYGVANAANFRSAIGAQASGNYAPHGWTQKATGSRDATLSYSLSGCTEVMFVALSGTAYLGSCVLPVSVLHASTARQVYLGGGATGGVNGRAFGLNATTTRATRATTTIDNAVAGSCTWWVFAR